MNEETATALPRTGAIHDLAVLDLRTATAEDLSGIQSINDVGVILIPDHLAGALTRININDVGVVAAIPTGVKVSCFTGQTQLTGDALASGDPETILVVVGQAFIKTPVVSIGYREMRVYGQLFAPRGSESAIGSKLTQMDGQLFYLPVEHRTIMGSEKLGREFLELLPSPTALVIMGELEFEDNVTVSLLQVKITEIVLMGCIRAPKALVPLLQVITREKMGEISAKE
jgi:hypothetical protein